MDNKQTNTVNENIERVKHSLHIVLDISEVENIDLQNVHRVQSDGKSRSIIAKFTNYNDHEIVRKAPS